MMAKIGRFRLFYLYRACMSLQSLGLNKVHPSTAGGRRPQRRGRLDRNDLPLLT